MNAFWDRMKSVGIKAIGGKGQKVILERTTDKVINPVTGKITGGNVQELVTNGMVLNYDAKDIDGTRILTTDKELVIDGTIKPLKTDRPKVGGEYIGAIVNIKEVNPSGTQIVFFVQVRG